MVMENKQIAPQTPVWKSIFFVMLGSAFLWAQGDDNLLMQYNRGPDLDGFYHRWNAAFRLDLHRFNTDRDYTLPRLSGGVGLDVQHNFSKTFGLNTGLHYLQLKYQYAREDNDSTDRLNALELPLTGRLSPGRRLFFEMGALYLLMLKAENSEIVDLENNSTRYPKGIFQNALGLMVAVHYNTWKGIHLSLTYRRHQKSNDPTLTQSNRFHGLSLGLHYYLKNPLKKPPL